MKRNWCPSVSPDTNLQFDASHVGGNVGVQVRDTVSEHGAVAAHNDRAAFNVVSSLKQVGVGQQFSASVVASRTNMGIFPIRIGSSMLGPLENSKFEKAALILHEGFTTEENLVGVSKFSVPADHITQLLEGITRKEAQSKSFTVSNSVASIEILPSLSETVPLDAVLKCIEANKVLLTKLESFSTSDTPTEEDTSLLGLIEKGTSLKELSLVRCGLGSVSTPLFEAIKDSTLVHLNVEGNDLGLEEYEESAIEPLSELMKLNKFVRFLNLAYNNLSVEAVTSLVDALCDSDTLLLPEDLPQEEEDDIPIEELLGMSVSDEEVSEAEDLEDEEEPAGEEEGEEEEEAAPEEPTPTSAGEEDEEEQEEEESLELDEEEAAEKAAQEAAERLEMLTKKFSKLFRKVAKEEDRQRKQIKQSYKQESLTVANFLTTIRAQKKKEKDDFIANYCSERSGWSRIQYLILRGNKVSDKGCVSLARLLESEVNLNEEEVGQIEERLKEKIDRLISETVENRARTRSEEVREWSQMVKEHDAAISTYEKGSGANGEGEEEDEYAKDAPPVVFSNIENKNSGDDDNDDGNENDESALLFEEIEGTDCSSWQLKIQPTKAGMNSIVYLDLSSTGIGSKGLSSLSNVLKRNSVLRTLILRNNPFNTKFKKVKGADGEEQKEEVKDYVSPGFSSFAETVASSTTLEYLDLGYCNLQSSAISYLSRGLKGNVGLSTLCLEGNRLCVQSLSEEESDQGSCLRHLLDGVNNSNIQHLNLSHNDLHEMLWQDELELLVCLCQKLSSLFLNGTGLCGNHFYKLYLATSEAYALQVLHISRNQLVSVEDAENVGLFLSWCTGLTELCLDEHPKLSSEAVRAILQSPPPDLVRLSCNRVGITDTKTDAGNVFSPELLRNLHYLSLSDIDLSSPQELHSWTTCLVEACQELSTVSLWSRKINMESHLDICSTLVDHLSTLLYADFGVLLRFDGSQDLNDTLGRMEATLTQRRLLRM